MDDIKQQSGQVVPPGPSQQGGTLVQFPTQISQPAPAQDQVPTPTGLPKEQEPFSSKPVVPEVVTPTEQSVELAPDVKEAGVKEVTQTPTIPQDLAQMGVQATEPLPDVSAPQKPPIKTPISLEKAEALTKGSFLFKNPSSSLLWLAMVVLRQLRMKKKEEDSHAA